MTELTFAKPDMLVEPEWLAEHRDDPALRVFDCTVHLIPDPKTIYRVESGRADYERGHIPGAGFLDLDGVLSDHRSKLRFTLPSGRHFAAEMAKSGIGDGVRVVLYAQGSPQGSHRGNPWWATRIWWMLRVFGFDDVALLNGGFRGWQAAGLPVSNQSDSYPPASFTARLRPHLVADRLRVEASLEQPDVRLVNALRAEQHAGTSGAGYHRPGRIAGSVNLPAASLFDTETDRVKSPSEVFALLQEAGTIGAREVVAYCGGGIAATAVAFALRLSGTGDAAVYDGSLSEWGADPTLPMETD